MVSSRPKDDGRDLSKAPSPEESWFANSPHLRQIPQSHTPFRWSFASFTSGLDFLAGRCVEALGTVIGRDRIALQARIDIATTTAASTPYQLIEHNAMALLVSLSLSSNGWSSILGL